MRIKRTVFLFFLLCTGVVYAQKTVENLFLGTWSDGQSTLKVEYLGKDFVCTFVNEKGDSLNTKNIASDGDCMYIDFLDSIDSSYLVIYNYYDGQKWSLKKVSTDTVLLNQLDLEGLDYELQSDTVKRHLIFSCALTKGKMVMTKHSIMEFTFLGGRREVGPKSCVGIYRRVGKIAKVPSRKVPVDSVKVVIARQLKSIVDLYMEYLHQDDYNYGYFLEMNTFDKYNTAIYLIENMYPSLKSDSVMMRRYTECLFSRAIIYKNYLANTDKYIEDLRKIKCIIPYKEVVQDLAISEAEHKLSSAKSLSDTVRIYEKVVDACHSLEEVQLDYSSIYNVMEGDTPLTTEVYLANSVLSPIIYGIRKHPSSGITLDSVSAFFLKNPHVVYRGNVNCAVFTMLNSRSPDAIAFYESIKQNFSFNDSLNTLYVRALSNMGYSDKSMRELLQKSLATSPSNGLHQEVQLQVVDNDLFKLGSSIWEITEDIEGNVEAFAKYFQVPEYILYALLAYSYYYNNDYQRACSNIQTSFSLCQNSSFFMHDYSDRMLLYANILSHMSKKEQSAMQQELQIQEAKKSYQAVIDYEDSLGIIINKPLAYTGLKKNDKAVESLEKMLEAGMDSVNYFLMVAQVYARLGDTARAYFAITKVDEIMTDYGSDEMVETRDFWERMREDPYLELVRDTIVRFCEKYEKKFPIYHRERVFDTITTKIPFYPSRNGTIYLKECRIGNIELNGLIFDPGAEICQMSHTVVDKLLEEGLVSPNDCLGPLKTVVADGKKQVSGVVYRLSSFEIGTIKLENIHVFVPDAPRDVPLLLGENVFGDMSITINPRKLTISFTKIVERIDK